MGRGTAGGLATQAWGPEGVSGGEGETARWDESQKGGQGERRGVAGGV